MQLRPAKASDINAISKLLTALCTKYILPDCTAEGGKLLLASMTPDLIKKYFDAGYQYHVADVDGIVVGVVGIKENIHLYHLFVADPHQGKGLSTKLWEMAKNECLAKGNKGFFTVNSAISAKNVYIKLGFVSTEGIRERSGIKDIPMQLTLKGKAV